MTRAAVLIGAALAGFVALQVLAHLQATAAAEEQAAADTGPAEASTWDALDLWGMGTATIERNSIERTMTALDPSAANVAAFLTMIEHAEGTARGGRDPYRTCYAYRHTIRDLAEHPAVSGEWKGEPLDSLGPQYAGLVSTAAGRYQIIRRTWLGARKALGLRDFGPASQDRAAVWLIKNRGALADVQAGRFAQAVDKCRAEWASLPGAGYGQPERKLGELQAAYTNAGGTLA